MHEITKTTKNPRQKWRHLASTKVAVFNLARKGNRADETKQTNKISARSEQRTHCVASIRRTEHEKCVCHWCVYASECVCVYYFSKKSALATAFRIPNWFSFCNPKTNTILFNAGQHKNAIQTKQTQGDYTVCAGLVHVVSMHRPAFEMCDDKIISKINFFCFFHFLLCDPF